MFIHLWTNLYPARRITHSCSEPLNYHRRFSKTTKLMIVDRICKIDRKVLKEKQLKIFVGLLSGKSTAIYSACAARSSLLRGDVMMCCYFFRADAGNTFIKEPTYAITCRSTVNQPHLSKHTVTTHPSLRTIYLYFT